MEDRRIAHRVACTLPLRLTVAGQAIDTLTKDLGPGGVRCLAPRPLKLFSPVTLELMLGRSREPLVAQGLVRWTHDIPDSQQYFIGVTFLGLDEQDTRRLTRYISSISRQPANTTE